ncbi:MAG: hypothetical protein AAGJ10_19500 [Bacteroidota bacterium]
MENDDHNDQSDEARELRKDIAEVLHEFEASRGYSHDDPRALLKQKLVRKHKGKLRWDGDLDALRTDA